MITGPPGCACTQLETNLLEHLVGSIYTAVIASFVSQNGCCGDSGTPYGSKAPSHRFLGRIERGIRSTRRAVFDLCARSDHQHLRLSSPSTGDIGVRLEISTRRFGVMPAVMGPRCRYLCYPLAFLADELESLGRSSSANPGGRIGESSGPSRDPFAQPGR